MFHRFLRSSVKRLFAFFGLELRRLQPDEMSSNAFRAMQDIVGKNSRPLIFDVGGNVGQSVLRFRGIFPDAEIHSFEPASGPVAVLANVCKANPPALCWPLALGVERGEGDLQINERSVFNSFRAPRDRPADMISGVEKVPVSSVDEFCTQHSIEFIDILKSDTEGFDSEVFKGASRMLAEDRIGMIYFECYFQPVYQDIEPFHETYAFLLGHGFSIVNFFKPRIKDFKLQLNDTLLINDAYAERFLKRR